MNSGQPSRPPPVQEPGCVSSCLLQNGDASDPGMTTLPGASCAPSNAGNELRLVQYIAGLLRREANCIFHAGLTRAASNREFDGRSCRKWAGSCRVATHTVSNTRKNERHG